MKKIIAAFALSIFFFESNIFAFAQTKTYSPNEENTEILYPQGEDFARLQKIISETFDKNTGNSNSYYYSCINNNSLCPNYKYTSINEKAIKFIIAKTFVGNEDFYKKIFIIRDWNAEESAHNPTLAEVLQAVPVGNESDLLSLYGENRNISENLLQSSFGINFNARTSYGMLGAIADKIENFSQDNCSRIFPNYDIFNRICLENNLFLPTFDELKKETIYLNGGPVQIESVAEDIVYTPNSQNTMALIENTISGAMIDVNNSLQNIYQNPLYKAREDGQFRLDKLSNEEFKSLTNSGVLNLSGFDKDFSKICNQIRAETGKKNNFGKIFGKNSFWKRKYFLRKSK